MQKIHNINSCKWAREFTSDFLFSQSDSEDEGEEQVVTRHSLTKDETFICCCHPNLEHDESLKFKLMFSNSNEKGDFSLYSKNNQPGKLEDLTGYEIGQSIFKGQQIYGRNKSMYKLYQHLCKLKNTRIIQMCGEQGMGKTTLAKQMGNYVYERGHFRKKIVYETFRNITSITTFMTKIKGENCSIEKLCQQNQYDYVLYILDDCDQLIDQNKKNIQQKLRQIIENTNYIKFLLITQENKRLEMQETSIHIGPLDKIDAAKIFIEDSRDFLFKKYLDCYELANHPIFEQFLLSPGLVKTAA